jgi:hypothetical protein
MHAGAREDQHPYPPLKIQTLHNYRKPLRPFEESLKDIRSHYYRHVTVAKSLANSFLLYQPWIFCACDSFGL